MDVTASRTAFDQLDAAGNLDLLTSIAATLVQLDQIGDSSIHELRLSVSSAMDRDHGHPSLLLALANSKSQFLGYLTNRYGVSGLFCNVLRYHLRTQIREMRIELIAWAKELLEKSSLVFNRTLVIHLDGKEDNLQLFSAVITEVIDKIAVIAAGMRDVEDQVNTLRQHAMQGSANSEIDAEIAKNLGFAGLDDTAFPGLTETLAFQKLGALVCHLSSVLEVFVEQLRFNVATNSQAEAQYIVQQMRNEGQKLVMARLQAGMDLASWEVQRRHILQDFSMIRRSLQQLCELTLGTVSKAAKPGPPKPKPMTSATKRSLVDLLYKKAIAFDKASEAVDALYQYLDSNKIRPQEMLAGELCKAHPSLTVDCLETLQRGADAASLMVDAGIKKQDTSKRAGELRAFLHNLSTLCLAIGLSVPFALFGSCGLKTRPRSEVIEPRPDIPYHDELQQSDDKRPVPTNN